MSYLVRPSILRKTRPYGRMAGNVTHGTRSTYNAGCGCEDCLRAERLYSRKRSEDRVASRKRVEENRERDRWTHREDVRAFEHSTGSILTMVA